MTDQEYKDLRNRWLNSTNTEAQRKYYAGFSFNKIKRMDKKMYEQELNDLALAYAQALDKIQEEIEPVEKVLTAYMERFVALKKQKERLEEKLETLTQKRSRHGQEED